MTRASTVNHPNPLRGENCLATVADTRFRSDRNGLDDNPIRRPELDCLSRLAYDLASILADFSDAIFHVVHLDTEVIDAWPLVFAAAGLIDRDMHGAIR